MKQIGKKILTGTIAAGFLLGGGLTAVLTQANAQDTSSAVQNNTDSTVKQDKSGFFKKGMEGRGDRRGFGGGSVLKEAATVLGVEQSVIMDELKQGKTLAQIAQDKAGLSQDDFLQKLVAAETTAIDAAVTSGKLTQEQADKQKTNLTDRLTKEITNTGFGKGPQDDKGLGRGGNILQQAATILGVEQSVIQDELKQGKTWVQIAQDKAGLSEDDFLQKLVAAETTSIDAAVTSGKLTQEQANKQKSGLSDRLKKVIENTQKQGLKGDGFNRPEHFGGAFGNYDTLAKILGITKEELTKQLQAGSSLVEIAQSKGLTEDQLVTQIKDNMTDSIKQFVESKGKQPREKKSQTTTTSSTEVSQ
ncbi:hypothetical protein [Paenibacillus sp. OAS669]|uniref:hypothetical protein n=1 Tax=Paenibacillus sp. OAS669 TaxID=2663821 RepID=UPI00178AB1D3|nr:hypothetical protein [Paenibacillus sp. OAS669]MBE1445695.1 ribosomal protein S20 [Paenibacillus sp. OAS669]